MADATRFEKLRRCGRLETYSTASHYLHISNNVGLAATYSRLSASSVPLETLVYAALRQVVAKHPSLSVIILNEDKSYPNVYYARLPAIDLRRVVEFRERRTPIPRDGEADKELDSLLMEQHGRGFNNEPGLHPLWRLIIHTTTEEKKEFIASWFFHHAPVDGTSAFVFHETFLTALELATANTDSDPIVETPNTPLVPNVEELHPMHISKSFALRAVLGAFIPSVFNKRPAKLWTGNAAPAKTSSPLLFKFRTFVLSAEETMSLVRICRRERTSVTATLQCLLAASLFSNLPAEEYERLKIKAPISMRPFLNMPEDLMINAVAQYEFLHTRPAPISQETSNGKQATDAPYYFSWEEARAVKAAILREVAKNGCDNPVSLLRYVPDIHRFFTSKLDKPRETSAEISNIGLYKRRRNGKANENEGGSKGQWWIGRMTFSQCSTLMGSAIDVNVVTGGDGNAVMNVSWDEGAVDEGLIVKVMEDVKMGAHMLALEWNR